MTTNLTKVAVRHGSFDRYPKWRSPYASCLIVPYATTRYVGVHRRRAQLIQQPLTSCVSLARELRGRGR
jgi:hypothetical protein